MRQEIFPIVWKGELLMNSEGVIKKTKKFYISIVLNVIEGIISGCNFTVLYYLIKSLVKKDFTSKLVINMSILLAVIFIIRLVIYSIAYTGGHIGGAQITRNIRLFLGDKIKKIPLNKFTKSKTGEYINAVTSDVSNYENILTHRLGDIIKNISLLSMLIIFISIIYLPAGMISLIAALIMLPALWLSTKFVKRYGTEKNKIMSENVSNIVEYITGIQTFRAYGLGGTKNETVTKSMEVYSDISYKYETKIIPIGAIESVFVGMCIPAIVILGYKALRDAAIDSANLIIIIMLPLLVCKLATAIFIDFTSYKNMMVSRKAIEKVANEDEELVHNNEFSPKSYDIKFENVCFSYDNNKQILENISFTAEKQNLTAIVGDSGSGKSTILNLIAKYYKPQAGNIKIGDICINNIDASKVLNYISIVDQEAFLFNDTVKKNILYAREAATEEEIIEALREANCNEFVSNMENGYDTFVGENGNKLSGGERQRLSIARAVLKDSPIVLLDEATASLDIENELAVKNAIINLLKRKKTVIMIAHTLSIIENADNIIVVADGKVVEQGRHKDLIKNKGKYYNMWLAEQQLSNINI